MWTVLADSRVTTEAKHIRRKPYMPRRALIIFEISLAQNSQMLCGYKPAACRSSLIKGRKRLFESQISSARNQRPTHLRTAM